MSEVGVVGWPGGDVGEEIAAFVVAATEDETRLLAYCREHLVRYKVPKRVFFLDSLPKNNSGKIAKAELAKLLPPHHGPNPVSRNDGKLDKDETNNKNAQRREGAA